MKRAIHMTLHIPCVILLALHDWYLMNKDTFSLCWKHLVRDIKCLIPKMLQLLIGWVIFFPPAFAFLIFMIKFS